MGSGKQMNNLSSLAIVAIGFMIFALFLGAGNIIFPVLSGALSGENVVPTAIGFLITGVGMPLVTIVAMSKIYGDFNSLIGVLPKLAVVSLAVITYSIIGPLYGIPRTAATSYEIGIVSHFPSLKMDQENKQVFQAIYSIVFFAISWVVSLRPGRLMESVGEYFTPALIVLLIVIGLSPFFLPVDSVPITPVGSYLHTPFLQGFVDGYATMDTLAALMFSSVITINLRSHNIIDPKAIVKYSVWTASLAAVGIAAVYVSLFNIGSISNELAPNALHGGEILTLYVKHQLGAIGVYFTSIIVILACLTTSVGLLCATAEYFAKVFPFSYFQFLTGICIFCSILANVDLGEMINFYKPVLFFIYPIVIALVMLILIKDILPNKKTIFRLILGVMMLYSILEAAFPMLFEFIPGESYRLGWILPLLVTTVVACFGSYVYTALHKNK